MISIGASRARSFMSAPTRGASMLWQQELENKSSFKVVVKVGT
jgi:hypothetical protein